MGLTSAFNVSLHCPLLTSNGREVVLHQLGAFQPHELDPAVAILDEETPIKKLFMLLEMARHGGGGAASADGNIPLDRWITCMEDLAGIENAWSVFARARCAPRALVRLS